MIVAVAAEPDFMMYAGSAVFLVGLAWAVMRWIGRTIKQDLDPGMSGRMRASMAIQADTVPPQLVKEALAKGLVTSQQLATMSPVERQFLFKSLMPKLSGASGGAPVAAAGAAVAAPMLSPSAPALPLKPSAAPAPVSAPQLRSTQAMVAVPGKPMTLPPLTPEQLAALGPPPGRAPGAPPQRVTPPGGQPVFPSKPAGAIAAAHFGAEMLPQSETLKVHCPCCGMLLAMPAFAPYVAFCDQCGAKTAVRTEDQGRMIINTAPPGVTRRPVG